MSESPNRSRSQVSTCLVPRILDLLERASVNASHCSSSAWARAASMSSFWLRVEQAAAACFDELVRAGAARPATSATIVSTRSVSSWRCDVRRRAADSTERAVRPKSVDGLREAAEPDAVTVAVGDLLDDVARERPGVGLRELPRVVGEQALGDELQQHVVVALERRVDVEVGAEAGEAVLGEEPAPPQASRASCSVSSACQVDSGLRAAARVSRSWRSASVSCSPLKTPSNFGEQLARARRSSRRSSRGGAAAGAGGAGSRGSPLRSVSLPAVNCRRSTAVGDRDLQGELRTPTTAAPSRETRPCTSVPSMVKKRRPGLCDGRGVGAVLGDVAVAVEQVVARHAHAGEVQPAVVDAVEAALQAVVLAADARAGTPSSSRIGT